MRSLDGETSRTVAQHVAESVNRGTADSRLIARRTDSMAWRNRRRQRQPVTGSVLEADAPTIR